MDQIQINLVALETPIPAVPGAYFGELQQMDATPLRMDPRSDMASASGYR